MLAGASGLDIVLLVIAADEGVMPQTREHFDICRLLGIQAGAVVLSKTDMVDAETLELAKLETAELVSGSFLENAPVIGASSRTGDGLDQLKETLSRVSRELPKRNDKHIVRLPIDRSFSMKGFGAVVTGTLASSAMNQGAEMELFPAGKRIRVRGLQTHGKVAQSVNAGQRAAVNLAGIDHSDITRGMTLAEPGVLRPTPIADTRIEVLSDAPRPLRSRQRVRVHIGTAEVLARIHVLNSSNEIERGGSGFAQLRLEAPIVTVPGERFIVRTYSPQTTIGGGTVIDAFAIKHHRKELNGLNRHLEELLNALGNEALTVKLLVNVADGNGLAFSDLQARTALRANILGAAIEKNIGEHTVIDAGGRYISEAAFRLFESAVLKAAKLFHTNDPLSKGMPRETLREKVFAFVPDEIFRAVVSSLEQSGKIVSHNETIRLDWYKTELSEAETEVSERIKTAYQQAGLDAPKLDDALADAASGTLVTPQQTRKLFQTFLDSGEIVKVTEDFYFGRSEIDKLVDMMKQFADNTSDRLIDMSAFKELAGVSRKYAIPLLEYFDRVKVTQRVGDKRIILK